MAGLHDNGLLWLIHEGNSAHPLLATVALLLLLFALPNHRPVFFWSIAVPLNALCILCLVLYGAWTAAPLLAWAMLGMLVYQLVRAVRWRAQAYRSLSQMPRWLWVG